MKTIKYLGKELDLSEEHEIFSENEFGFDVTAIFDRDGRYCLHNGENAFGIGLVEHYHNCTEVHHLYPTFGNTGHKRIAFESDIHGTGFTYDIDDLEEVIIELSYEKTESI